MSVTVAAGLKALEALKLAAELERTLQAPNPAQRTLLESWTGWGALSPAFEATPSGTWAEISDELSDMLTGPRHRQAATSLDVSFFTPVPLAEAVWDLLQAAGFTGGRVLEPGCGTGAFLSAAPVDLPLDFVGIERDETSASIARLLHPKATIKTGDLTKTPLPESGFDAVIGNFPFASGYVYDQAGYGAGSLHEYFMRRSLAALRPGGYLAVLTSSYVMDGQSLERVKEDGGQFVAAMRLPEEVFAEAGAQVVCDIILIRKAPRGEEGSAPVPSSHRTVGGTVSGWWEEHPELVAGEFTPTGFYQRPVTVRSADPEADVASALAAIRLFAEATPMTSGQIVAPLVDDEAEPMRDGAYEFVEEDGARILVRTLNGETLPVARPAKKLLALVELRDLSEALLEAEADANAPDSALEPLRKAALDAYNAYVAAHGPINAGTVVEGKPDPETGMPQLSWRPVNLAGFRSDPGFYIVSAMEVYDQETGVASPAPILLRRINKAPESVTSAETPEEALAISLGESGRLDLTRVAGLLGLGIADDAVQALGDLVYSDPDADGEWVTARDYLSGNVREKLGTALAAAAVDSAFERNVTALSAVLPSDLGPAEIRVSLGVPWIDVDDYKDFCREVLGAGYVSIEHSPETASWEVTGNTGSSAARVAFGVDAMNPIELFNRGMNNKAPVVTVYDHTVGKDVRDAAATAAAQEKLEAIRSAFSVWIWDDPDRTERICREYNQRFRSHVPRTNDGSYLRFPTMAEGVVPYWWQQNIVDRVISSEAVLCGHTVGAGKTLSMAMSAVALRQFGLANKPAIVVPNHLLEQISREMRQAFPLGKFLIATKEDLTKDRRRGFAARCASGDWDAVVMTHGAFTSLAVHPDVEAAYIRDKTDELHAALYTSGGHGFSSRQISRKLRSYKNKLERMLADARKDEGQVFFEHLGIDYIAVDEAHYMKRLDVGSRMDGFSMGASKRALDLLLKVTALRRQRGGKPVLGLFTGTPLTNSLVEIFVWQTFLQPEVLEAAGLSDFNAWAANFVHFRSVVEISPEGGSYRTKTRPVSILNAPELYAMFSLNADLLSAEDINLERPEADTRQRAVAQSPLQREFTDHLVLRAEKLRRGTSTSSNDNMLAVVGDGRRCALDPRLVGVDEDSVKLQAVAEEIVRIWEENKDRVYGGSAVPGALQVAFCDQGTPSTDRGSQTYGRLRRKLIDAGMPAERIRFIHEVTDDKSRAAMFAACRRGDVSVLLGSTEKLGTGTNIQDRLKAVHHVDAPWRPSDIEQRDGRAMRPKNLNKQVELHRYVVEGTFDAYQWQLLETKAVSFLAMTSSKGPAARDLADISEVAPSYTQMKALAAGDPRLLEQAETADKVARLQNLRAQDRQSVNRARKSIPELLGGASAAQKRAEYIGIILNGLEIPETAQQTRLGLLGDWARKAAVAARTQRWGSSVNTLASFGSLTLQAEVEPESSNTMKLSVVHKYSKLDTVLVGIRHLGRDPEKTAQLLWEKATEMVESLPGLKVSLEQDAARWRREAADAEAMVSNYRFAQQDELDAALDTLERINRELEYSAEAAMA